MNEYDLGAVYSRYFSVVPNRRSARYRYIDIDIDIRPGLNRETQALKGSELLAASGKLT